MRDASVIYFNAPNGPITFASLGLCTQILFGPPSAPRVSISER
jgi:hypothetical protein